LIRLQDTGLAQPHQSIQYNEDVTKIYTFLNHHPLTLASQSQYGAAMAAQLLKSNKNQLQSLFKSGETVSTNQLSKWTQRKWEAAEDHLRLALQTAIDQPCGKKIATNTSVESETLDELLLTTTETAVTSTSISTSTATATATTDFSPSIPLIQTLSAAAAAQNLAVILKIRGTEIYDKEFW
jgi:hypothetical protein